jgi:lipoprotein LpqH
MNVQWLSAVGAVAILVVGAVGCSKGGSSTEAKTTSAATSSAPAATGAPAAGAGSTKVTIGGQPKQVDGAVVCSTNDGKFSIAIGDMVSGIIIGLEPDASKVRDVGLGDVNGVVLSFTDGVPGQTATATKDGNTYTVKGTATGVDQAGQSVSKPFEVVATCP